MTPVLRTNPLVVYYANTKAAVKLWHFTGSEKSISTENGYPIKPSIKAWHETLNRPKKLKLEHCYSNFTTIKSNYAFLTFSRLIRGIYNLTGGYKFFLY
jgi:hypothetical protein